MSSAAEIAADLVEQAERLLAESERLRDEAIELQRRALRVATLERLATEAQRPDSPPRSRFSPKTPLVAGGVEP